MILNHDLYLLIFRKLRIQFTEHFLGIETSRHKENEVRRLLWHDTAEFICELFDLLRLHGNTALVLVSDEDDFLDVSVKPLFLYVSPLLLLRIGSTTLVEEHISDSDEKDYVQPGDTESKPHGFLPARCFIVFRHILILY